MDNDYDIIIIGGGPAGYSAAIYASRAMLKTLLIESYSVVSQLTLTDDIENYPGFPESVSGYELLTNLKNQSLKFGLTIKEGFVKNIEKNDLPVFNVITENDERYSSKSVILASGAKAKKLNIPGENKFGGRGVSYCAVCDGAFFKEKEVAVVGGGDTAIQEALFLTKYASKVTLIHRRDQLRAEKVLQQRVFDNPKIEIIWDSVVEEVKGKNGVENIVIKNVKDNKITELKCSGFFIFIGFSPNTNYIKGLVNTTEIGFIPTDNKMRTNIPGIFAAGDLRYDTFRQIATAVGDGATASLACEEYLSDL